MKKIRQVILGAKALLEASGETQPAEATGVAQVNTSAKVVDPAEAAGSRQISKFLPAFESMQSPAPTSSYASTGPASLPLCAGSLESETF